MQGSMCLVGLLGEDGLLKIHQVLQVLDFGAAKNLHFGWFCFVMSDLG